MKYIELKQITPSPGQEYNASSYPGPGMYQLPSGKMILAYQITTGTPISVFGFGGGLPTIDSGVETALGVAGGVDVHRLLDQMIALRS